tara:strand:- start:208 stop:942 length:735 start_codon:yes stop_codon:yes gene_type:complete
MFQKILKLPLIKRLIPSIIKKLNIKSKNIYRDNVHYNLDLRYFVDRNFYLYGWDEEIIKYLNLIIKKNNINTFLDIGSCWGIYTLKVAKQNPNIKIFSFDVFIENINRLKLMLQKNKFDNVKTFNLAIGLDKKIEKFAVNEEFSPNYARDLVGKKKIEVQQDKIDNLIEYSNEIIAIKIDVERMELDVLKGAENLLKKNKCFIIVETDQNEINVINFLNSIGYQKIEHNFKTIDSFFSNFNEES